MNTNELTLFLLSHPLHTIIISYDTTIITAGDSTIIRL